MTHETERPDGSSTRISIRLDSDRRQRLVRGNADVRKESVVDPPQRPR